MKNILSRQSALCTSLLINGLMNRAVQGPCLALFKFCIVCPMTPCLPRCELLKTWYRRNEAWLECIPMIECFDDKVMVVAFIAFLTAPAQCPWLTLQKVVEFGILKAYSTTIRFLWIARPLLRNSIVNFSLRKMVRFGLHIQVDIIHLLTLPSSHSRAII